MVGPQGLEQALSAGGRFQGEIKLLPSGEGWKRSLLRRLVMQTQSRGGELMQLEDPQNPTMIDGEFVTGLDNPREFTGGEGMRECQADNLLLDVDRYLGFDGRLPASVLEGAPITV